MCMMLILASCSSDNKSKNNTPKAQPKPLSQQELVANELGFPAQNCVGASAYPLSSVVDGNNNKVPDVLECTLALADGDINEAEQTIDLTTVMPLLNAIIRTYNVLDFFDPELNTYKASIHLSQLKALEEELGYEQLNEAMTSLFYLNGVKDAYQAATVGMAQCYELTGITYPQDVQLRTRTPVTDGFDSTLFAVTEEDTYSWHEFNDNYALGCKARKLASFDIYVQLKEGEGLLPLRSVPTFELNFSSVNLTGLVGKPAETKIRVATYSYSEEEGVFVTLLPQTDILEESALLSQALGFATNLCDSSYTPPFSTDDANNNGLADQWECTIALEEGAAVKEYQSVDLTTVNQRRTAVLKAQQALLTNQPITAEVIYTLQQELGENYQQAIDDFTSINSHLEQVQPQLIGLAQCDANLGMMPIDGYVQTNNRNLTIKAAQAGNAVALSDVFESTANGLFTFGCKARLLTQTTAVDISLSYHNPAEESFVTPATPLEVEINDQIVELNNLYGVADHSFTSLLSYRFSNDQAVFSVSNQPELSKQEMIAIALGYPRSSCNFADGSKLFETQQELHCQLALSRFNGDSYEDALTQVSHLNQAYIAADLRLQHLDDATFLNAIEQAEGFDLGELNAVQRGIILHNANAIVAPMAGFIEQYKNLQNPIKPDFQLLTDQCQRPDTTRVLYFADAFTSSYTAEQEAAFLAEVLGLTENQVIAYHLPNFSSIDTDDPNQLRFARWYMGNNPDKRDMQTETLLPVTEYQLFLENLANSYSEQFYQDALESVKTLVENGGPLLLVSHGATGKLVNQLVADTKAHFSHNRNISSQLGAISIGAYESYQGEATRLTHADDVIISAYHGGSALINPIKGTQHQLLQDYLLDSTAAGIIPELSTQLSLLAPYAPQVAIARFSISGGRSTDQFTFSGDLANTYGTFNGQTTMLLGCDALEALTNNQLEVLYVSTTAATPPTFGDHLTVTLDLFNPTNPSDSQSLSVDLDFNGQTPQSSISLGNITINYDSVGNIQADTGFNQVPAVQTPTLSQVIQMALNATQSDCNNMQTSLAGNPNYPISGQQVPVSVSCALWKNYYQSAGYIPTVEEVQNNSELDLINDYAAAFLNLMHATLFERPEKESLSLALAQKFMPEFGATYPTVDQLNTYQENRCYAESHLMMEPNFFRNWISVMQRKEQGLSLAEAEAQKGSPYEYYIKMEGQRNFTQFDHFITRKMLDQFIQQEGLLPAESYHIMKWNDTGFTIPGLSDSSTWIRSLGEEQILEASQWADSPIEQMHREIAKIYLWENGCIAERPDVLSLSYVAQEYHQPSPYPFFKDLLGDSDFYEFVNTVKERKMLLIGGTKSSPVNSGINYFLQYSSDYSGNLGLIQWNNNVTQSETLDIADVYVAMEPSGYLSYAEEVEEVHCYVYNLYLTPSPCQTQNLLNGNPITPHPADKSGNSFILSYLGNREIVLHSLNKTLPYMKVYSNR